MSIARQPPNFKQHAIEYAATGLSIIPVIGKQPACRWRHYQKERPSPEVVQKLFERRGITGLAVVLGRVSGGLAARDFDDAGAYHTWAAENPADAKRLPTVQTARGFHVYGRLKEEVFIDLGDGELRADSGHYVLLPPSVHPDGPVYSWLNPLPDGRLPLLPRSLTWKAGSGGATTHQPRQHIACVPPAAVDAIEATLPSGPGQRNRRVFDLARRLKGIANLDTSPAALKAIVAEWHRLALPVINTKPFGETRSDFQVAWQRVKRPHGTTVRAAFDAARRKPLAPIDDSDGLGVLAALCRNLGATCGAFYLSCRTVEELFGVPRMTAWRWLQAIQFHGVIEPVSTGTLKDRQASTWAYTGEGDF